MKMTAGEAVVQIMVKEGITDAFGIPGAGINPVYKYLENAPIMWRPVPMRRLLTIGQVIRSLWRSVPQARAQLIL